MQDLNTSFNRKAILFCLKESIERELAAALRSIAWDSMGMPEACGGGDGSIIFCLMGPAFREARTLYPATPIVIVSRISEWNEHVEALEAGAADYYGAPFEPQQLRWIVETRTQPRRMSAGATGAAA
jgi:PleD family two-component response regulator